MPQDELPIMWCPAHGSIRMQPKVYNTQAFWDYRRGGNSIMLECGCARHILPDDLDFEVTAQIQAQAQNQWRTKKRAEKILRLTQVEQRSRRPGSRS